MCVNNKQTVKERKSLNIEQLWKEYTDVKYTNDLRKMVTVMVNDNNE